MLEIKRIVFYWRFCPESQVFKKNLTDWHDKTLECCCRHTLNLVRVWSFLSHWRYLPRFIRHEILINFVERKKVFFFLKIFHFSICLTSNKLYWIEDQLADVSTRFYTSASWTVGDLTRYPPLLSLPIGRLSGAHLSHTFINFFLNQR